MSRSYLIYYCLFFYWGIAGANQTEYVGSDQCKGCHRQQYQQWQGSHHQLAMQVANKKTVLADFNNSTFDYFDITSRFFTKAGKYFVNTDGPNGKMQDFEIKYVFGVAP
ncbi:MAG: multiheme c-type cytochrome, partial [Thiohalomonadales bacterium]